MGGFASTPLLLLMLLMYLTMSEGLLAFRKVRRPPNNAGNHLESEKQLKSLETTFPLHVFPFSASDARPPDWQTLALMEGDAWLQTVPPLPHP